MEDLVPWAQAVDQLDEPWRVCQLLQYDLAQEEKPIRLLAGVRAVRYDLGDDLMDDLR